MPGTPTSTTTSLSALSTTAIKDGHRGHFPSGPLGRGHQHSPSSTSLEAERADRISRLAGLERVSALRPAPTAAPNSFPSPQTTPTSVAGFPAGLHATNQLTPAYFDSHGQPVAVTKMSTVGSASATESQADDVRTTAGDRDEDMLSTGTNYREADSVADPMDEDGMDALATRSLGGYDDRMSDDGSASLVGFGEGAGSTVSGPIYHRRPPPNNMPWTQERSASSRDRDILMASSSATAPTAAAAAAAAATSSSISDGADTPMTASAIRDRPDPRMMDGIAATAPTSPPFVDTTLAGPVPVSVPAPDRLPPPLRRASPRQDPDEACRPHHIP
ncbi:myb DNA-binding domain containing protein [Ophiocordyceps camponoti-floridani]|uniref:Myb DNA-binding domain containing protein n=1 Tax=Ophiocordyceps camponoti-floridani TaxID=2030778 RepID=A0A8H4VDX3_9HYPO|nr:myb DNA-binding domain containing protein [Ophiocordyceps camponoti-floridani]